MKKRIQIFIWIQISVGFLFAQESKDEIEFNYGMRLYREGLNDLAYTQFQFYVDNYPLSPHSEEAQFLSAESAFLINNYQEALKSFTFFIIRYSSSDKADLAQFRIGECFEKMGNFSEAMSAYLLVDQYYPSSEQAAQSLFKVAQISFEQNHFKKAESVLKYLSKKSPSGEMLSKSLFLLADVYKKQEAFDDAILQLERLAKQPILQGDAEKANFELGYIYKTLGYWDESENVFKRILTLKPQNEMINRVNFQLGLLAELESRNEIAASYFENVGENDLDDAIRAESLSHFGTLHFWDRDYKKSLAAFEKAEKICPDSTQKQWVRIWMGKCQQSLSRDDLALHIFQGILDETENTKIQSQEMIKTCLLLTADLHFKMNDYQASIAIYQNYLQLFADDLLADCILLKIGKIYQDKLELAHESIRTYDRFLQSFPRSRFASEVRYRYAECLLKSERVTEAVEVLDQLVKCHPGNDWAELVGMKIQEIERDYIFDYQQNLSELTTLIEKYHDERPDDDQFFLLGEIHFKNLKQYKEAITRFREYRKSSKDSQKKIEALYYMGTGYENLFRREKNQAFLDSAKTIYSSILADTVSSEKSVEAGIRLADLVSEEDKQKAVFILSKLLQNYPKTDEGDKVLFKLGLFMMQQDSLRASYRFLSKLVSHFPKSSLYETAFGRCGQLLFTQGHFEQADSLFGIYQAGFPDGSQIPDILLMQSKIAEQENRIEKAVSLLDAFRNRFPNHPLENEATVRLGRLYLERFDYKSAEKLYSKALEMDSLQVFAHSVGLENDSSSIRKVCLSGLAKAYTGMNELKKAKSTLFELLKADPSLKNRSRVFVALAEISETEKDSIRAADYLKCAVKIVPDDSSYQALGMYQFRMGNYSDAIVSFGRALELKSSEDQQSFLNSSMIVAMLRQDQIPQAQVRMAVYEKTFKSDPDFKDSIAELVLEEGKAFFRRKEFDSALESFEKVITKYKKSSFAPEAEFEIGRTFLVTNKIAKALDVLTGMIEKYPAHPILAKVYVNLGDHYFRSQQFDNALSAFKKVLDSYDDAESIQLAMRYLIRVYDSIRMWDAALALTRKYIEQFPKTEDVLQKRVQIGLFYMRLNSYPQAIECFKDVKMDADPETEAEIQYWIGKCYNDMGDFEQAIFEFLKVKYVSKPTKLPWASTALYEAGMAYIKLEKFNEACKLFEKVVQSEGAASDMGRIAKKRIEEIKTGNMGIIK